MFVRRDRSRAQFPERAARDAFVHAAQSMMHLHDHSTSSVESGGGGHRERRLLLAFVLTAITLAAEAIGGWLSGSLALLADAAHMLVDAAALLFAWLGARIARRPADARRSFGYARMEVLVGYSNALAQFALVAWIGIEALRRLSDPQPILSGLMLVVALAGLAINLFVLGVLSSHESSDVNTAAAKLHVLGDLLGSFAAVAAALLIRGFGWLWADPLLSVLVSLLILGGASRLLRRTGHILLEGTPEGLDGARLGAAVLEGVAAVCEVHHVHVWQLAGDRLLATLHVRLHEGADADRALSTVRRLLHERFHIDHATVQLEAGGCAEPHCDH